MDCILVGDKSLGRTGEGTFCWTSGKVDAFWFLVTHKRAELWDVWLEETHTAWISCEQSITGLWRRPTCHSLETFWKYLYGLDGIFHLEEPPLWRERVHTPATTTQTEWERQETNGMQVLAQGWRGAAGTCPPQHRTPPGPGFTMFMDRNTRKAGRSRWDVLAHCGCWKPSKSKGPTRSHKSLVLP